VKPHPNWFGINAPISELKRITKRSNVKVVHHSINPLDLIRNSMAVATINSTTGLEAIGLKKPVLTFGHNFYSENKGVAVCVHDLRNLTSAVRKILYEPDNSYNQKERDLLLAKYYKHIIPIDEKHLAPNPETDKSDGKRIAEEFIRMYDYCF
jgi:capsule polysaccharide modification protein KpsS